jgi:hypothetical protein
MRPPMSYAENDKGTKTDEANVQMQRMIRGQKKLTRPMSDAENNK